MPISTINNGDSGLSARTSINEVINVVNGLTNRANLGGVSGTLDLVPSAGAFQYCYMTDDLTFGCSAFGTEGDSFIFVIQYSPGGKVLDIGATLHLPSWISYTFPFTPNGFRSMRFQIEFMGGLWCVVDMKGDFQEVVD